MKKIILAAFVFIFSLASYAAPTPEYRCSMFLVVGNTYFTGNKVRVSAIHNEGMVSFQETKEIKGQFTLKDDMTLSLWTSEKEIHPTVVISMPKEMETRIKLNDQVVNAYCELLE